MSNLVQRIITGIIGAAILISAIYLGDVVFLLFVAVITIIGLLEFYKLVNLKCYSMLGILVSLIISGLFFLTKGHVFLMKYDILLPALLSAFVLLSLTFAVLTSRKEEFFYEKLKAAIFTIFGIFYVSWLLNHLILIRIIPVFGRNLVFLLFFAVWSLDIFAYFFGMKFGKTKFSKISPKKSVEGAVAGFLACILTTWGLTYLMPTNLAPKQALILGGLLGIFGQIGDFAESLIKRSVGAKDSGTILPGHGGVLDRFDSIIFTAPIVYYFVKLL